jgi:hypothetical protein
MSIRGAGLLVFAIGCNRDLGSIEGYDLGNARSAAWAKDAETDRVRVVASDNDDVCGLLADGDPEATIWTLTVTSTDAASYEEELSAEAVAVIRDGVLDNDYVGDGAMQIDDAEGDLIVHVDVTFDSDRVNGVFRAEPCEAVVFDAAEPTTGDDAIE